MTTLTDQIKLQFPNAMSSKDSSKVTKDRNYCVGGAIRWFAQRKLDSLGFPHPMAIAYAIFRLNNSVNPEKVKKAAKQIAYYNDMTNIKLAWIIAEEIIEFGRLTKIKSNKPE